MAAYGRIEDVLERLDLVAQELHVARTASDLRQVPLKGVYELRDFFEIDFLRLFFADHVF
jgi:hypothetical protein